MKSISVLGSSGSIGKNTLRVASHLGISVEGLSVYSNIKLLEEQINTFQPKVVAVFNETKAKELRKKVPNLRVVSGVQGLVEVATLPSIYCTVNAIVGAQGIVPTFEAIKAGKKICLANKEAIIAAGELIISEARKQGVDIIPIDSEHSAIFQCLKDTNREEVYQLILTASGGPFRLFTHNDLQKVTIQQALNHPNWSMGKKISIDSSTLMNKGLEVLEAHYLFGVPIDQIKVTIHPQSVVHSFVEFIDGSLLAQLSEHDMRIPIQYALTHPQRFKRIGACFDLSKYSKMEFYEPNTSKFICLSLAYTAAKIGGTLPCFMNGANEILVERFLKGNIKWLDIGLKLERLMAKHHSQPQDSLERLQEVDREARLLAKTF